jgi:tetratricopeptide (TPR) repeat protein
VTNLARSASPGAAAFVGRDDELAMLRAGLDRARTGRGSLFLIGGEPGIGKSRLADEFTEEAANGGARVLWGRCWEDAGAPAYWPWIQIFRGWLRAADPSEARDQLSTGAADLAQVLPEIRALIPDLAPPPPDSPSSRFQLFDSATTLLRSIGRAQVTVLALDDVHAADIPSVLLLRFLAGQLSDMNLVVVATYRDVVLAPENPLTSALQEVAREPAATIVALKGLPEKTIEPLLAHALGAAPAANVVRGMWRQTGGNPLFLAEALRLLEAEGSLDDATASGQLRLSVPPGVRDVISRRLSQLPAALLEALTVGSALGPEFSAATLRRAGDDSGADLDDLLDQASKAGLLMAVSGSVGRLRFSHDLVREVLYQAIPPARRSRLHLRIATAIEDLHAASLEPYLAQLAHHSFEAVSAGSSQGEPSATGPSTIEKARAYARQAAELAVRTLAFEEASRYFRMALQLQELGGDADDVVRTELLLLLGDANARAGDLDGARRTFLHAGELARRMGSAGQLAAAALGYGGRFLWARAGRDTQLVPLLQDALVLLGGRDDYLRVRLLARLACAWRDSPPHREHSAALSEEAVQLARRLDDPSSLGYALTGLYWATWWPENTGERLSVAEEMLDVASSAGDGERIVDAHLALFASHAELGQMTEARAQLDTVARLADELRQPAQMWLGPVNQTVLALMEGDYTRAQLLIGREAEQIQPMTPIRDDVSSARMHRFLLHRELDTLELMESTVRTSVEEFPWYPFHRASLCCMLIDLGRSEEARSVLLDLARNEFQAIYRDSLWLMAISLASEACARLGDSENAGVLYAQVAPFAGRHAFGQGDGSMGAIDRYLGLLSATGNHLDEAAVHLQAAIELNDRMGARPWAAHSRHDLAVVLRQRKGPDDVDRAARLDAAALATATTLGMVALAKRIGETGAGAADTTGPPMSPTTARFLLEGEYWTIAYAGDAFRLRDAKGLRYLARLLVDAGRETLALELVRDGAGHGRPSGRSVPEPELRISDLGGAGALLDDAAKQAYRTRVHELQQELDEAEAWNDPERAERAREEMDFIARELSRAIGLGGRDRETGSASERARLSVTRAIRLSMARIAEHSPDLGRHLDATIRTGSYCSYRPDPRAPVEWQT